MGKIIQFVPAAVSEENHANNEETIHFRLQFFINGQYFGGTPDIAYILFSNFYEKGISVRKSIEKFCDENNSVITLYQSVVSAPGENKIPEDGLFIPAENQKIIEFEGTKLTITSTPLSPEDLEETWKNGIKNTKKSKQYYADMMDAITDSAQSNKIFIGVLCAALGKDMSVNGELSEAAINKFQDTDKDINVIFLYNFMDYYDHPEQTNRTFVYRGIHL